MERYIEFVGASGTGKSYLCRKILSTRLQRHIHFVEHAASFRRLLIESLKCLREVEELSTSCLLDSLSWLKTIRLNNRDTSPLIESMVADQLQYLTLHEPNRKLKESILSFYGDLLTRHFRYLNGSIPVNLRMLADEGLIANTRNIHNQSEQFFFENRHILPDRIVWVSSDLETITTNLELRHRHLGISINSQNKSRIREGYHRQVFELEILKSKLQSAGFKIINVENQGNQILDCDIFKLAEQLL